jgi:hypothetical protein
MDCPKSAIHGNVIACRTRAEVCRTNANNARTHPEEKAWLDLADDWDKLADAFLEQDAHHLH